MCVAIVIFYMPAHFVLISLKFLGLMTELLTMQAKEEGHQKCRYWELLYIFLFLLLSRKHCCVFKKINKAQMLKETRNKKIWSFTCILVIFSHLPLHTKYNSSFTVWWEQIQPGWWMGAGSPAPSFSAGSGWSMHSCKIYSCNRPSIPASSWGTAEEGCFSRFPFPSSPLQALEVKEALKFTSTQHTHFQGV